MQWKKVAAFAAENAAPSVTAVSAPPAPGQEVQPAGSWDKETANITYARMFNPYGFEMSEDSRHVVAAEDGVYMFYVTAMASASPPEEAAWEPQGISIDVLVNDNSQAGPVQRLTPANHTIARARANDTYTYIVRHALKAGFTVGVALTHQAPEGWSVAYSDVHLFVVSATAVPIEA